MGLKEIKRSLLQKDPKNYLALVLRQIFNRKKKQILEYIKLLMMLKTLSRPEGKEDMTKSFINVRQKVVTERKLSMKLMAIILDRMFSYRARENLRDSMNILKDKKIKIYKVLFGKVTPIKTINLMASRIDSMTRLNIPTVAKSMINSNSYVNFPRPSQGEHLSSNSTTYIYICIFTYVLLTCT